MVGTYSSKVALEVLAATEFTRPSPPPGVGRLWPVEGYFRHTDMYWDSVYSYGVTWKAKCDFTKTKVGYGCGWGTWGHAAKVDGYSRGDVCYLNGAETGESHGVYYQPIRFTHGAVVTEAWLLGLRRWGIGVTGGNSWLRPVISWSKKWKKDAIFRPDWWKLDPEAKNEWYQKHWDVVVFIPKGVPVLFGVELRSSCSTGKVETHGAWLEFRFYQADVTIETDKTTAYIGDKVTLSGQVTVKWNPYKTRVTIKAVDPKGVEKTIGQVDTDSEGRWNLEWTAEEPKGEWTFWAECDVEDPITIYSPPIKVGVAVKPLPAWVPALIIGAPVAVAMAVMIMPRVVRRGAVE